MVVTRWQALLLPSKEQIITIFRNEDLKPEEEVDSPGKTSDLRNPFDEIRMIVSGEMIMNVAGNKLLLRQGDKIMIPSNTRYSKEIRGDKLCVSIRAFKVFHS